MRKTHLFVSIPGFALGLFALAPGCGNSGSSNAPATSQKDAGLADATASTDASSAATCGDGVVSGTETCDTTISAGNAGACPTPTTCDDGDPCTTNAVVAAGTCNATCDTPAKVAASLGAKDQCCPPGADYTSDSDCDPNCGNGKLDPGEKCDPKIASGAGACDATCPDDGDPCTTSTLVVADPCNPHCNTFPITTPKDGDQCCPTGENATTDSDCSASCGNGFVEAGEDCDETSPTCKDCKFVPTAFRFTNLEVAQPRLSLNCTDITVAVNTLIAGNFVSDKSGSTADGGGADGRLDLSFILLARPLVQTGNSGTGTFLSDADCPAPIPPSTCAPDPTITGQAAKVTNQSSGACLTPDPTRFDVSDASAQIPNTPSAGADGCFVSDGAKLSLTISGIPLTFETARLSAEWVSTPATGMTNGVIEAFMSMTQARAIVLPASTPAVGGNPLSVLLRGSPENGCTTADDSRPGPDGVTKGYWFYFNFTAEKVAWTGN